MSTLDWSIQEAVKDSAWFTANPTHVLLLGQKVWKDDQSGLFKLGDGTTQLSALSFLGGGGSSTASNGITKVASDFQLGGALTQNTIISGASTYSLDLGTNVSRLSTFVVRSNSSNTLFFTDGTQSSLIFQNSGSTLINHSTGTNFSRLSFNGQAVIVNSDYPTFPGLQEASDYSANYTSLSLINKGYAGLTYQPKFTDTEETYTVTGTSQVLLHPPTFIYGIYLNGQRLTLTTDYTISTATITFTNSLSSDSVTIVYKY